MASLDNQNDIKEIDIGFTKESFTFLKKNHKVGIQNLVHLFRSFLPDVLHCVFRKSYRDLKPMVPPRSLINNTMNQKTKDISQYPYFTILYSIDPINKKILGTFSF